MPNRAEANQIAQFGIESTAGTGVAATKRLDSYTWEIHNNLELTPFRSQGRRVGSLMIPGKELTDHTVTGMLDYNQIVYLLSALLGKVTATTHSGGTTSKDWVWTVGLTGALTLQTLTVEKGDATRAGKAAYTFLADLAIKHNRKECPVTASGFGGQYQDGITLTASGSVTNVAQVAVAPNSWVVSSDTTFGGIGGTAQTGISNVEFQWGAASDTFFPVVSAASFDSPVDLAPKAAIMIQTHANAQGMSPLATARLGSKLYIRDISTGPIIEGAIPYVFQIDAAVQVAKVDKFTKLDGSVYGIGYELALVEDSSLGGAVKITVTNAIATL